MRKNGSPRRIGKRLDDSRKEQAITKESSVGIDITLSEAERALSIISLDATMSSGMLKATRNRSEKKKQVQLNYLPQNKSGRKFLEKIDAEEISIRGIMSGLLEASMPYILERAKPDSKKISAKEKAVKARQADKLDDALRDVMISGRWGDIVDFSPMRTEPSRVYEQKDIVSRSPTGEHMSRLLYDLFVRTSQTKQAKFFKGELAKWGKSSGLFSELRIRELGDRNFDPYQILVVPKKNAPPDNLVDVGYGVSQVLPIVSDILNSARARVSIYRPVTFLIQQPEVHLHPRAQAALTTFFYRIHQKTGARFLIETHSDYLLDRAAIEIQEARNKKSENGRSAKPQDIFTMLYFEQNKAHTQSQIHQLTFDENGDVLGIPKNYRNFFLVERKRHLGI